MIGQLNNKMFPLSLTYLSIFHKWVLNFGKKVLCITRDDHTSFYSICSLNDVSSIGREPMKILNLRVTMCWIRVLVFYWSFCSCIISETLAVYYSSFFFFFSICVWFWYQGDGGLSKDEFGTLLCKPFWRTRRLDRWSSLNVLIEFIYCEEPSGPALVCWEFFNDGFRFKLLVIDLNSYFLLLVWILQRLSLFLNFSKLLAYSCLL